MDTLVMALAEVWLLLCGRSNFNALGLTSVEVIMKKISNRKTRSVMDDMLNDALILLDERIAMLFFDVLKFQLSRPATTLQVH
jgi:hypothetical protein